MKNDAHSSYNVQHSRSLTNLNSLKKSSDASVEVLTKLFKWACIGKVTIHREIDPKEVLFEKCIYQSVLCEIHKGIIRESYIIGANLHRYLINTKVFGMGEPLPSSNLILIQLHFLKKIFTKKLHCNGKINRWH